MTDDVPALLWQMHDAPHSGGWAGIARELGYSPSLWWQIAHGHKPPSRGHANRVRHWFGLESLPPRPLEIIALAGIAYVIEADIAPDTALLVNTKGQAVKIINLTLGDGAPVCHWHKPRAPNPTPRIDTLDNIPPVDPLREGRGKSGYPPAIEAAARRAALALEDTESEAGDDCFGEFDA